MGESMDTPHPPEVRMSRRRLSAFVAFALIAATTLSLATGGSASAAKHHPRWMRHVLH